jgi:hypothetical protein
MDADYLTVDHISISIVHNLQKRMDVKSHLIALPEIQLCFPDQLLVSLCAHSDEILTFLIQLQLINELLIKPKHFRI